MLDYFDGHNMRVDVESHSQHSCCRKMALRVAIGKGLAFLPVEKNYTGGYFCSWYFYKYRYAQS
jgi:hypothetical protein